MERPLLLCFLIVLPVLALADIQVSILFPFSYSFLLKFIISLVNPTMLHTIIVPSLLMVQEPFF